MFKKESPCNYVYKTWKPSDDLYNTLDPNGGNGSGVGYICDFPPISVSLTCWTITDTSAATFSGRIWQAPTPFCNYNLVTFCDVDANEENWQDIKGLYHPIAPEYVNFFNLGSQDVKSVNVYEPVRGSKDPKPIEHFPQVPIGPSADFERSISSISSNSPKGEVNFSFGCRVGGNGDQYFILGQRKGLKENKNEN
jgi:hypothetical protein